MASSIDLHCHSTASDGILSPAELVTRAHQQGITMLALTDHDTTSGLSEAHMAAQKLGVRLIQAVEASCLWQGHTIHITGLAIDPDNTVLQAILQQHQTFRAWRGKKIGQKLEQHGIHAATAGAANLVQGGLLTRSHYAQFLYQQGLSNTLQKAFNKYLLKGKPGYVRGEWADLANVTQAILAAGGIACIAHPKRYKMTNTKLNRMFAIFKEAGGQAIEVVNATSTAEQINYLAQCAEKFEFSASIGSDFHFPNRWVELGKLRPLPPQCQPVWQHFKYLAM